MARGLVASRSRARDLIMRGFVLLDGAVCDRPAQAVGAHANVEIVAAAPAFVSRGAEKLRAALDAFSIDPAGKVALDIGASTGGFSQVLLARGAAKVYALDVGHDQLHACIRSNPRCVLMEKCDARTLSQQMFAEPIELIVADVSFISLTKALPKALALAPQGAWLIALIKPQFELTPADIGKGGIVREEASRTRAVENVRGFLLEAGWEVRGIVPSPIAGGSGNFEFLIGAVKRD